MQPPSRCAYRLPHRLKSKREGVLCVRPDDIDVDRIRVLRFAQHLISALPASERHLSFVIRLADKVNRNVISTFTL